MCYRCKELASQSELEAELRGNLHTFQAQYGVLLLLYSFILTKVRAYTFIDCCMHRIFDNSNLFKFIPAHYVSSRFYFLKLI